MEKQNNNIWITDNKNIKLSGEIIFQFEIFNEKIIFYQLKDQIFAAKINDFGNLQQIPEDEWEIIDKIYQKFQEEKE